MLARVLNLNPDRIAVTELFGAIGSPGLCSVPHRHGPFGAKGIGETGMFCVSPAIGNALYDAIEVRVMEMPLTPERVLRALRQAQDRPLTSD